MDCPTLEYDEKREKYLDIIADLCLFDNLFMIIVFNEIKVIQFLLFAIFQRTIEIVEWHRQHFISNFHGRSGFLDLYVVENDNERCINVEVQKEDSGAVEKRARYYGSLIDCNILLPKEDWKVIPPTCVIFITENDVLGLGKPIYHIRNMIDETGTPFDDGREIIYVNGSIQDETLLGQVIHDFHCTDYRDMKCEILRDRVKLFKESEGGKKEMCKKLDDLVKEETKKAEVRGRTEGLVEGMTKGKAEGLVEGKAEGLIEGMTKGKFEATLDCIKGLMASMKLNFEDAASKLNVSKEELPKYKEYLFS